MATVDDLLSATRARLARRRPFPESTYRLQFHAGFTFLDATRLVPYLHDLGITHCYASPYLQARPGSMHGYDIVNHELLNPEIGTDADFADLVRALHKAGMGQVLDMVPNHMGVGNDNPWWNDVLENGSASPYSSYFDITWHGSPRRELRGRVLLPVLGDAYGKVLEAQQLRLEYAGGAFVVRYFDNRFPVTPASYGVILERGVAELEAVLGAQAPALLEYRSILTALSHLPPFTATDPEQAAEQRREKEVIKRRLDVLTREVAEVRDGIERLVTLFNGQSGDPHSFDALDALLDLQPYRLSFWRVASDEINYRRFFDINELAALSMEKPDAFVATHKLIMRFLSDETLDGLRIDHPDGLYDPAEYLRRLQRAYLLAIARSVYDADPALRAVEWPELEEALRPRLDELRREDGEEALRLPLYVVVEKILGTNEPLPDDWETSGTSGYDFVNLINGLFVDPEGAKPFTRFYQEFTGNDVPFSEVVYRNKLLTLRVALSSELQMLAYQLDRLAQKSRYSRDFTLNTLRETLRQTIAYFPVYRSYISDAGVHETDRKYIETAVVRAMRGNPTLNRSLFRFVRDMLLLKYPEGSTEADQAEQRRFAGKFQQVTAPVMAKGMEDTSFYVYSRFLSLNEVGGDPGTFGVAPEAVHRANQERQARWPRAMAPLSTHDTKRSEDVRARLNVLSEIPEEWMVAVRRWSEMNAPHRPSGDERLMPEANEEYFLYQTLVGVWPLEAADADAHARFVQRIQEYMRKALHEAKVHSSWINPDETYDEGVAKFVAALLDESVSGPFLKDLRAFVRRVAPLGLLNGLAQTLLRITSPGVPDTYQGTEQWDFSLVDPDNRRPVNYERRQTLLAELLPQTEAADRTQLARQLLESREDGRVKLFVTALALRCRREHAGLFSTGAYEAAPASGLREKHVFGFVRRQGEESAIVVVPRLPARLVSEPNAAPLGPETWMGTRLQLSGLTPGGRYRNVFTGETLTLAEHQRRTTLVLDEVLRHFPVALLLSMKE